MRKSRINNKIVFTIGIIGIIFLALLLAFNLYLTSKTYKMELYVLKPDNTEIKVKECNSDNPDFECTSTYPCTQGTYARAITSMLGSVISDTSWEKIC
jgi:hypothetical protein